MKATKIKMKPGCGYSNSLVEIEQIYLEGCQEDEYYYKSSLHDFF